MQVLKVKQNKTPKQNKNPTAQTKHKTNKPQW